MNSTPNGNPRWYHLSQKTPRSHSASSAKFIVFEGIDGSGKSTQCRRLAHNLSEKGIQCSATQEPSYSGITGPMLRSVLSSSPPGTGNHADLRLRDGVLAYLFAADRYEHLYAPTGIVATLRTGVSVISDRYFYSSLTYQGDENTRELVRSLNEDFPHPDVVFYFDIPVDTALARITREKDSMERCDILRGVRERYTRLFESDFFTASGTGLHIVDASQSEDMIAHTVFEHAAELYQ